MITTAVQVSLAEFLASTYSQGRYELVDGKVVEIISPNQGFGEMTEKAVAYLAAGVARIWVVDVRSRTVTVRGDRAIEDELLPGLGLTPNQIFDRAGL